MKARITITWHEYDKAMTNSIHLGNLVATKLRSAGVPLVGGIVVTIDRTRATGSINWTTGPNGLVVQAEWTPIDDDDDL